MVVQNYSKYVFVLVFLTSFCWIIISQIPDSKFHLIACDVGQGDSILAIYKNYQILTDGGPPNGKVEKCLSEYLPFWDREIEVVINTHPQLDHFGGLIKVFENYKVGNFIANDLSISTKEYEVLIKAVGSNGSRVVRPVDKPNIRLGLMQYDVFYPLDNKVPDDLNDLSIQAILSFGEFKALMTGDIGENLKDQILQNLPTKSINYIKIPHHGSKNGMVESYLREIMPTIAVISVGKNNSYGHPSKEVIKILSDKGIKILRTDQLGDVEVVSNGKQFWVEN